MINRIISSWFIFINGWFYRKSLHWFWLNHAATSVVKINCQTLKDEGVEVLVLDFDGVLSVHGKNAVELTEVDQWLRQAVTVFGENRVFILSNNPNLHRKAQLEKQYPEIVFVVPFRKKPFTDGLAWVRDQTGVCYQKMLMVDDRLLTGVLSAVLHQSRAIYITEPYVDFEHSWLYEMSMRIVRRMEKLVVSI